MKHIYMSPFMSKVAEESGLFDKHVVASTLTRGFVQQIMTLEVISWEAPQERFRQTTEQVRARGLQETLSPWILAHVASQKVGKLQSQRK